MIDLATGEVAFADTYSLVGLGGAYFERLYARLIHLEDPDAFRQLRMPQGVAVQPGAEDHVQSDAGRERFLESILGVARAGCSRCGSGGTARTACRRRSS